MRPSRSRRAVRRPVHARHGRARDLSRRRRALDRADGSAHRRRRRRPPRLRARTATQPIEIGPIEKMSKSKRNTVDPDEIIDELRRRHRALVHALRLAARARRDLDRGGRAGRLQADPAPVAADLRDRAGRRAPAARPGPPPSRRRRPPSAAPPMARWPRSRTKSSGCASTSASRRSTNSPIRLPRRSARSRRKRSPTTCATPSPRPATFSSTPSRR